MFLSHLHGEKLRAMMHRVLICSYVAFTLRNPSLSRRVLIACRWLAMPPIPRNPLWISWKSASQAATWSSSLPAHLGEMLRIS